MLINSFGFNIENFLPLKNTRIIESFGSYKKFSKQQTTLFDAPCEPIRSQCTHMPNSLNLFFYSAEYSVSMISSIPELKRGPYGAHALTVVKVFRHLKSINFQRFPIANFIFKNCYWRICSVE